jgi:RNA polymerase sigma-70 factor (ECF subfamily)
VLHNPHDAEEAVQEAFARAWKQRHSCRSLDAPLPWLLRITHNEALRVWVRRRRRFEVERPGAAPDHAVHDRELEAVLPEISAEQSLGVLKPEDRRIVRMRYLEDIPQARVAAELHMPEMTVGVRLHRARKRLREAVEWGD